MRHSAFAATLLLALGGCSLIAPRPPSPAGPPLSAAERRDNAAAAQVATTLLLLQRLGAAPPAEQSQIVEGVRADYRQAPMGEAQLRYALVLALPGHAARDPMRAQLLLRELSSAPQSLPPVERALVQIELAQLNRELDLQVSIQQLENPPPSKDADLLADTQRHLQVETEENAHLHKQLEALQTKLDAIANIERNITERSSGSEGRTP
jgi:hypothetical protein